MPRPKEEEKKNPKRQHQKGGKEKQKDLPGQGSFEQEESEEHVEKQEDEAVQAGAQQRPWLLHVPNERRSDGNKEHETESEQKDPSLGQGLA